MYTTETLEIDLVSGAKDAINIFRRDVLRPRGLVPEAASDPALLPLEYDIAERLARTRMASSRTHLELLLDPQLPIEAIDEFCERLLIPRALLSEEVWASPSLQVAKERVAERCLEMRRRYLANLGEDERPRR